VHLFFTSEYNGCVCLCRVPPRVCVYNSFFCQKLLTSGYEGVRRWKNKIVSSSHCMHAFVYCSMYQMQLFNLSLRPDQTFCFCLSRSPSFL
jgi:hypothetical protein